MGYTQAELIAMFMALFVILVLGVIFRHALKNATLTARQIPIMVVGATILIMEVIKQVYHLANGNWKAWYLPFHFCSFFLIWYALALFTRGRIRQLMYFCSLSGGILVTILLFAAPRMIIHEACKDIWTSFDNFHTFFFHMGLVAYWVWMLMLGVYQPRREHVYQSIIVHTIFYFVVIAAAYIFQQNYVNVLESADIAVLDNLRLTAGQFTYTFVLLLVGVAAISIVSAATYFILNKLYHHNLNKQRSLTTK